MSTEPADLIVIAYDGTENARRAIRYAGRFLAAERAILVTVWEPMVRQAARMSGLSGMMQPDWLPDDDTEDIAHVEAREVAEEGLKLAADAGLQAEARCIESGTTVWTTIVEIADELDADVIVTGTRGTTGLRSLIHSSTADQVLRHSHRPVMIVPPGK
ncbi:universal stress protein [Tomitella fengzijianii]|uniref:Universal stress protein n=1 Tax=Tomitella fengzijianii TaxID=2597660 RepID=A0A516X617_9ACTN|nr:universal stress protein [Tomitella fengzijianii]QDQ98496.1 universal stress protein [Tomitella fengzijianii]